MDIARRQWHLAGARDSAVQRLRDLTIAIAIAAAAGVGLAAWVGAATIPGSTVPSGQAGAAAATNPDQPTSSTDEGLGQAQPGRAQPGSGVAVSGGSH